MQATDCMKKKEQSQKSDVPECTKRSQKKVAHQNCIPQDAKSLILCNNKKNAGLELKQNQEEDDEDEDEDEDIFLCFLTFLCFLAFLSLACLACMLMQVAQCVAL